MQPGLLDRDVLQVVDPRRIGKAEHAADTGAGAVVRDLPVRVQLELVQLLLQGHLLDEAVDLLLYPLVGPVPGRLHRDRVGGA